MCCPTNFTLPTSFPEPVDKASLNWIFVFHWSDISADRAVFLKIRLQNTEFICATSLPSLQGKLIWLYNKWLHIRFHRELLTRRIFNGPSEMPSRMFLKRTHISPDRSSVLAGAQAGCLLPGSGIGSPGLPGNMKKRGSFR